MFGDGDGEFAATAFEGGRWRSASSVHAIAAGGLDRDRRAVISSCPATPPARARQRPGPDLPLSSPTGFVAAFVAHRRPASRRGDRIADFDADGDPDVAVSSIVANAALTVFLGDGAGGFHARAGRAARARHPSALRAADVDGPGHLDLVAQRSTATREVAVLIGDGHGGFSLAGTVATGRAYNGVAVADLDGDGDIDAVAAGGGSDGAVLPLVNDGHGTLVAGTPIVRSMAAYVTTGDFDADGRADVAVAAGIGFGTAVMLGNGDGTFAAAEEWETGPSHSGIVTTDVDGDGRDDLSGRQLRRHGGAVGAAQRRAERRSRHAGHGAGPRRGDRRHERRRTDVHGQLGRHRSARRRHGRDRRRRLRGHRRHVQRREAARR